MAPHNRIESTLFGAVSALFGPLLAVQTYKHLLYLTLAFPLSLCYWFVFGFGMLFGTLFSIVLIGLVVLLIMVIAVRFLVVLERWLANALLGVSIDPLDDVESGDGFGELIRGYLDASSTWRGFGYLSLKFYLGIIGIMLLYGFIQGLSLISSIARRPHAVTFGEVNGDPLVWTIETIPETILAVGAGVLLVLVVLHLANGFSYVAGQMATALLGSPTGEPERK